MNSKNDYTPLIETPNDPMSINNEDLGSNKGYEESKEKILFFKGKNLPNSH